MAFIQIVEFTTSKYDEVEALERQYDQDTGDKSTVRRTIVTRDHSDPTKVRVLVFFDSYESAMENSNLPETAAFGEKVGGLIDGPMTFHDLDVIDDRE